MLDPTAGALIDQYANLETIWAVLKWAYVLAFFIYAVFAVVVVSQIKHMIATLKGAIELPLKLLGYGLLALSLAALLASIVLL